MDFRDDFYRGQYSRILRATIDGPKASSDLQNAPWVIGALCFQGRLFEAERLFAKYAAKMKESAATAARSFLAINHARASDYPKARALIIEIAPARKNPDETSFYFWLALAFYHSARGRQGRTESYALKALGRAIDLEFPYGKVLARDLLAHTYAQGGRFSAAFSQFRQASLDVEFFGDGAIAEAVRVSLALHSARHGLAPLTDLVHLESILATLSDQDSFSAGKLLMELGRQCLLRGMADRARDYYSQAAKIIGAKHLPWFSGRLAVRQAHLAWFCGNRVDSEMILAGAEAQDQEGQFSQTKAEFSGLRRLMGLQTKKSDENPPFNAIDARIKRRSGMYQIPPHTPGDDPLGDLLDLIERDAERAVDAIVRDGYWGLLGKFRKCLGAPRSVHFAIVPSKMIIFDKGNVIAADVGASSLFESVLVSLASGWCTKEHLIQSIWGYAYHPAKHDALVYSTMTRLRSILPRNWIASIDGKYRLIEGIQVVESTPANDFIQAAPVATRKHSLLSRRQMRLAYFVENTGPIDAKAASNFLGLSEVSARRELSYLVKTKYIKRLGKGRATTYGRAHAESSITVS